MGNKEDFLTAIANNNLAKLENLLTLDASLDIDKAIREESTALHFAVLSGNLSLARLLLKYDANPELEDEKGNNCLHLACKSGSLDLVKLFVQSVDIEAQNFNMYTPLHIAAACNSCEIVEFLLNNKANVNAHEALGFTALHLAVRNKNVGLMELLLDHNANPNIQDIEGMSAFYRSFYVYRQNISNRVIDLFLKYNAKVCLKDMFDNNALHIAAMFGTNEFLQLLLHRNMSINEANESKKLPLSFALESCGASNKIVALMARIKVEILLRHVVVLQSRACYVDRSNLELIEANAWMVELYERYSQELVRMQATRVTLDSGVTYYDVLVRRGNALVNCLKSEMVNCMLEFGDYKGLFGNYAKELEINYRYGLEQARKMERFRLVLRGILGRLLPADIIYKLGEFYKDEDYAICLDC